MGARGGRVVEIKFLGKPIALGSKRPGSNFWL